MTNADTLYELAEHLLAQTLNALATTPDGAPVRSYVSSGEPAYDCEQVTVHQAPLVKAATDLNGGTGATNINARRSSVNLVTFIVCVVRCARVVSASANLPGSVQIDSDAHVVMRDQWVVWNYLQQRVRDETLFPDGDSRTRPTNFGPSGPFPTQGGVCGFRMAVTVEIGGYAA